MQRIIVDEKFKFELTDEDYELALAALQECAPEQVAAFTAERFFKRASWLLIPDVEFKEGLRWYKAEMVIKHGPPYEQTIKLNKWELPDLRMDGAPMPHNHPWPFRGNLLKGGYEETRYEVQLNREQILVNPWEKVEVGGTDVTSVAHRAGDVNDIPLTTFHEVTKILERGTLSLMDCDLGRKEGWGHLEDDGKGNLVYIPNKEGGLDKRFMPMMLELNPHRRR